MSKIKLECSYIQEEEQLPNYEYEVDYNDYHNDEEGDQNRNERNLSQEFAFIDNISLIDHRNEVINDCCELTCLSKDKATSVLIAYQWRLEDIRDNWFNTEEATNLERLGLKSHQNKLSESSNLTECLICFNDLSNKKKIALEELPSNFSVADVENNYMSLGCNHNFCGDCWLEYVCAKVEDQLTLLTSYCPFSGCHLVVPESSLSSFIKLSSKTEFISALEKAIIRDFTEKNKDIKICPNLKCNLAVRTLNSERIEIECRCGILFCFKCGKEAHQPCSCETAHSWELKTMSEGKTALWLLANTKICPRCNKRIEKNEGCNHMTCQKGAGGCGYEFCWICLGVWKIHGTNYYNCTFVQKNKTEQDNKICFNKFQKAVKYFEEINDLLVQAEEMKDSTFSQIKLMLDSHHILNQEFDFLTKAMNAITLVRRRLKYCYALSYYINSCKQITIWGKQKKKLTSLSKDLELSLSKEKIEELSNIESFSNFQRSFSQYSLQTVKKTDEMLKMLDQTIKMSELLSAFHFNPSILK